MTGVDTAKLRDDLRRLRSIRSAAQGNTAELDCGIRRVETELNRREAILASERSTR